MNENREKIMEEQEIEQVEYNLSGFKIGWIAELIRSADMQYLKGSVDHAFESWKCIYGHISSRLTKVEQNGFKKREAKFRSVWKNHANPKSINPLKAYHYEMYHGDLQKMLKKYGFDIRERVNDEHLV